MLVTIQKCLVLLWNTIICSLCTAVDSVYEILRTAVNNKNVCLQVKWPIVLSDFNLFWNFVTDFVKVSNIKFHENPSSGSRVDTRRQADRRTDRYEEGNRRFLQVMGTRLKRYVKAGAQYTEAKVKKKGGIEFSVGGAHYNARSPMKSSSKSSRMVLRLKMWW